MRSRHIFSLASAALVLSVASGAKADTTRLRVSVDELPKQNEPFEIDAKSAVLPNGAKDHSPIPKSWRKQPAGEEPIENSRCTDDRRGSVGTIYATTTTTRKIWEADGKTWLDTAFIDTTSDTIKISNAERVPLARIADGLWGYRRKAAVVLVAAQDNGFTGRGGPSWDCGINESEIAMPAGARILQSSTAAANEAIDELASWSVDGKPTPRRPRWVGVDVQILASVSKSSADETAMLNVVIKRP